ncbi:porin [Herbaspirillum sp. DW155]|uniref:porin n=1 Tax=Herbaspirillum sp. DW155 TaxID=3095609 RepID=UPI00308EDF36|nr:porin [Herbaspirillum sp. DW155]
MKKTLLVLAVLGTYSVFASAQSNVTIYGVLDAGITRESGTAGSVLKLATGVQSGNRIGFKGSEDLGGGLKANFQLENGFNGDTGTIRQGGALFGRQAYVGLSGNFGAVNAGRQYNPVFITLDSIDPFGTGLTGSAGNLMASGANGDVRTNNSFTYNTPEMGGLVFNGMYGLGEVAGDASRSRYYALSVGYANGPLGIALAYDNANDATGTNTTRLMILGGTYNFGAATMHLAYETEKDNAGMNYRDWLVGLSAPVGAGSVMASYIRKSDRSGASLGTGAKQFALGYSYPLSKRTNLYTSYGRINNDAGGKWVVSDASSGGTAVTSGDSSTAITFGMRHRF